MVVVAGHRALLLLAATVVLLAVAIVAADEAKPTILTPVAQTPVETFEGESPAADDAMDNDDATPIGSPIDTTPIGFPIDTTMMELKLDPTPAEAGDAAAARGKTPAASATSSLAVEVARLGVVAAVVIGAFAF